MTHADERAPLADVRIDAAGTGAALYVHVVPGAKRAGVKGAHGERLKVAIDAPPEGGRANKRLVAFLATALGVPRSRVEIASGASSRRKRVAIDGLAPTDVRAALEEVLANG